MCKEKGEKLVEGYKEKGEKLVEGYKKKGEKLVYVRFFLYLCSGFGNYEL